MILKLAFFLSIFCTTPALAGLYHATWDPVCPGCGPGIPEWDTFHFRLEGEMPLQAGDQISLSGAPGALIADLGFVEVVGVALPAAFAADVTLTMDGVTHRFERRATTVDFVGDRMLESIAGTLTLAEAVTLSSFDLYIDHSGVPAGSEIPEPASWALLAAPLALFAVMRRRVDKRPRG